MKILSLGREEVMERRFHVEVKQHKDWYFATCEELDGLFVGHQAYETVLRNIPEGIAMILKHERGQNFSIEEVSPETPTILGQRTYIATTQMEAA